MPKQLAVTKIRIFWVWVHLSPLKLTFFNKICIWLTRVHSKVNVLKKWGRYVDLNIWIIHKQSAATTIQIFWFQVHLSPLKFIFEENVLRWTYKLLYNLYVKKKSGQYDDFKVQYWRERPGRQNGKFSLVLTLPSLHFIFPAGIG